MMKHLIPRICVTERLIPFPLFCIPASPKCSPSSNRDAQVVVIYLLAIYFKLISLLRHDVDVALFHNR